MGPLDRFPASRPGNLPPGPVAASGPPAAGAGRPDQARFRRDAQAAAEKFESFFVAEILKPMHRAAREIAGGDAASRDRAGDELLEVAHSLVADALASQRAFGVADAILRQLLPAGAEPVPAALNAAGGAVALPGQALPDPNP